LIRLEIDASQVLLINKPPAFAWPTGQLSLVYKGILQRLIADAAFRRFSGGWVQGDCVLPTSATPFLLSKASGVPKAFRSKWKVRLQHVMRDEGRY
jgi:hypothetical protein